MKYLAALMIGIVVGAVINVLADDLPERRSPRWPRCVSCGNRFAPGRWLATVRWLRDRRRCPVCGSRYRWRHLSVELGTGLIFALLWSRAGVSPIQQAVHSAYMAIFVLLLVTDLEHRLILHVVTIPALALALLSSLVTVTPRASVLGAAIGFVCFMLIYLFGGLVFGAGAMGFGDVTLATFIGAASGFPLVVVALLVGVLTGGVISLGLVLIRVRRLRSKVPYGPFLLIGAVVALVWGHPIINSYLY